MIRSSTPYPFAVTSISDMVVRLSGTRMSSSFRIISIVSLSATVAIGRINRSKVCACAAMLEIDKAKSRILKGYNTCSKYIANTYILINAKGFLHV